MWSSRHLASRATIVAQPFKYREEFFSRALHVVVDHDVPGDPAAVGDLAASALDAGEHVGVGIPAAAQAFDLVLLAGRDDEDDHR